MGVDPVRGDLTIPINATLTARDPAAVAFTVEQPGGVVVTKRERVVGLAQTKGS